MNPRELAEILRRGLAPDNLDAAIGSFDEWSEVDPAIGSTIANILRQVRGRWDDTVDPGEFRRVTDLIVNRALEILRRTEEQQGYSSTDDLIDLIRSYKTIK